MTIIKQLIGILAQPKPVEWSSGPFFSKIYSYYCSTFYCLSHSLICQLVKIRSIWQQRHFQGPPRITDHGKALSELLCLRIRAYLRNVFASKRRDLELFGQPAAFIRKLNAQSKSNIFSLIRRIRATSFESDSSRQEN